MAIREKIRAAAEPFLRPGETIQAVFVGDSWRSRVSGPYGDFWWALLSWFRPVVVTDQRIIVFNGGKLREARLKSVLAELPRATHLGPAAGSCWVITVGGNRVYVSQRFFKDIAAADDAITPAGP